MICLTLPELVHVAERPLGGEVLIRDHGSLQSASARPRSTALGADPYVGLAEKAAALLHSLARNHALVDGNKRLALAATIAFLGVNGLGMNGTRLRLSNDDAYELVMAVAEGELNDVAVIADRLEKPAVPR